MSPMDNSEKIKYVNFKARLLRLGEKQIRFEVDGKEHNCPRSLLSWRCDKNLPSIGDGNNEFTLSLPKWKAEELDL